MIPTLLGVMVLSFVIIQAAPGGPVERLLAELDGTAVGALSRITGGEGDFAAGGESGAGDSSLGIGGARGSRGLEPEFIAELRTQFGFDKPLHERFLHMMGQFATFDFGESYFQDRKVVDLVVEKLPVSVSIGLWTTLITYLVSIPLGIAKATRDGSRFDVWSSGIIVIGTAIPGFLFAVLLVVIFAGGRYLDWFPLRGLVSDNFDDLSLFGKITDYLWHMALPVISLVIGAFAGLSMLTKNSFLDEIGRQYVVTARAKGLPQKAVLYGHVFRNAMLIVISGFPAAFIGILFAGSLLIEVIFSLDGLGLLGFKAAIDRDYPVMFATLYFFTLLGLIINLITDLTYTFVDPRIDFEARG